MQTTPNPTSQTEDPEAFGLLQLADTAALARIARGEVDVNALARRELANRGCDASGQWVGFEAAAKALGIPQ